MKNTSSAAACLPHHCRWQERIPHDDDDKETSRRADATLAVLPVGADGKLKPVVQMSAHPASRVNPERQASAHVHSTIPSPDG